MYTTGSPDNGAPRFSATRTRRKALALTLLLALPWAGAAAQTPSQADLDAAAREAEAAQRDLRIRQQEQRRQDLQSAQPPTRLKAPEPEPVTPREGPCRDIASLQVEGVTLLEAPTVAQITARYAGRCLGVTEIEKLLSEFTLAYIEQGYVGARVYLPQQDLSTGVLRVQVIEGRVQGLQVEDGEQGSISLGNVAPGMVGEPLNLRDLEQTLDQINRLASNNASFDIRPGEAPGDSVVVLNNAPSRAWRVLASYDNHGSESTGRKQAGLTVMVDNPLGFNDFISLTHRRAAPYESGETASHSTSLSYVLPYGYSTYNLSLSHSEYASTFLAPSGVPLHSHGNSGAVTLGSDRVVYRDGRNLLRLRAGLTVKESKNYLEDILLEVSSRRLSILDLDADFSRPVAGGLFSLQLGFSHGLSSFSPLKDAENLPDWAPRAQFSKFRYGFAYTRPFSLGGQNFSWSSSLVGQKSDDVLYGSEQISIGGIYSVRGFTANSLSGDDGFYLRNELSHTRPYAIPNGPAGYLRPYLALDTGQVRNRVDGVPEGSLTGAAVGLGIGLGPVTLDVFHARPVSHPGYMERESGETWFRLSATL
ncbi:ShlB/FhaC/HecB family hemolysin secretion/activation protein [Alkalilimnicola sp. S0819]|uniref:ShlB/FhaC/HecB family hemolysin secretion/activation protein n=1 Tax=Alkalilimnicola sp. S0819 TaxID=2613922 RepID=UPI00126273EF|nr:ShlB/FhaC/HecB family hemolysin secretion/activation protein [Alkalilimnicola sp. S0819]KAB7624168.1 ShlB/FhaC/HecB family hemolysin secretion/activation protein [Alkalilimnicola sp. S0819]MPQ16421.1 ShlB/FhaC/HecB family hemolysin secretion/activation protein [Alkalilimnicola sp. S0819]